MSAGSALLRRDGVARDGRLYRIRPSREDDAPALAGLRAAVAAEGGYLPDEPSEPGTLEQTARLIALAVEGGLSLSAEADGEVVAHVMVQRRSGPHRAHVGEIAIIVRNSWRGVGVGRALMDVAIAWGRAVGLAKLALSAFPGNARAIGLYRSLGFVDEGLARGEVRMRDGDRDLLLMGLALGRDGAPGAGAVPWYPAAE